MKRDQFLKTLATLTGGLTVVGCDPLLIDEMLQPDEKLGDLSIEDAEKWFNEDYLSRFSHSLYNERRHKVPKREAAWKKAQKPKNDKQKDLGWVWIPLEYHGDERPGVVVYTEETKYKIELQDFYKQPIVEGIVVLRAGKMNKAFLAQIAYDPLELEANNYKIDKSNFTGTIIRSDWDNTPLDGSIFEKGKLLDGFINSVSDENPSPNERTQYCQTVYLHYTTVTVYPDYSADVVGHTDYVTLCSNGRGNGGWGDSGSGRYNGEEGTVVNSGDTGNGVYWDPLVHSGSGSTGLVYPPSGLYNFNLQNAINNTTTHDRQNMNENLLRTIKALGFASSLSGWSLDKAMAMARCIGSNVAQTFPLIEKVGTRIAIVNAVYSTGQLIIGLSENGFVLEGNELNIVSAGIGIAAVFAIGTAAAPWIAVGGGAVTVVIGVYTLANE